MYSSIATALGACHSKFEEMIRRQVFLLWDADFHLFLFTVCRTGLQRNLLSKDSLQGTQITGQRWNTRYTTNYKTLKIIPLWGKVITWHYNPTKSVVRQPTGFHARLHILPRALPVDEDVNDYETLGNSISKIWNQIWNCFALTCRPAEGLLAVYLGVAISRVILVIAPVIACWTGKWHNLTSYGYLSLRLCNYGNFLNKNKIKSKIRKGTKCGT